MVHRLIVSYRGTAYGGWQRQTNAPTIQATVEEALGKLLGEPIRIHGASRTDAGVHAYGQTAHLSLPRPFPERGLVHGSNHFLPSDIRILAAERMPDGFHARKCALGKSYVYRVFRGRTPPAPELPLLATVERPLDIAAIRQGLGHLPGRHDFTAFALAGGSHHQPFRRLFAATVDERDRELVFRFYGDGFLRGMVRSLVGTLLEVGEGRRTPENMAELLTGRPRSEAGRTAAAQGLSLEKVVYGVRWRPMTGFRA